MTTGGAVVLAITMQSHHRPTTFYPTVKQGVIIMANAVDGAIHVILPINARSEAAFKSAVDAMSTTVKGAVTTQSNKFPIGTSLGDAAVQVVRTAQMFEKSEPVEAKPTRAKKGGRKATKKVAAKKVRGAKKAAAPRKAAKKRAAKKGGRR